MRNTFNRMIGKTRYVVSRLFLHLNGQEVAPILGVINRAARKAIDADGDLEVLGEELVQLCQTFLQYDEYWYSAANEGDVFWSEGEAGDYVNELFTDSAQRYGANLDFTSSSNQPLTLPVTENIIVMITVAAEGEFPELETDLANISALKTAFSTLINLHYKHKLRAIQVHFSPAQLGDELSRDQLLEYYPELIPL
ncbi:MAG: DUF1517 domain-containing protein [Cuspidothrix sp.]